MLLFCCFNTLIVYGTFAESLEHWEALRVSTVTACVVTRNQKGGFNKQIRTFETHTNSLLNMLDWLLSLNCTHVAMESTGEYWRPVFNILESSE